MAAVLSGQMGRPEWPRRPFGVGWWTVRSGEIGGVQPALTPAWHDADDEHGRQDGT